jgi:hypothetical protein
MKSLLWLAGLLFAFAASASAQQHAPTVDVCRADAAVWNAAVMNRNPEASKTKLPYDELAARAIEMHDCLTVDPAHVGDAASIARMDTYSLLEADYTDEIASRAMHFIQRHGLGKQFLEEDAAGAR